MAMSLPSLPETTVVPVIVYLWVIPVPPLFFLLHVCDPNPFVRLFLDKPCLPLRPSFPRAVKSYEALRVQDRADPQGWRRDWVSSIRSAGTYYSNIHLRPLYVIRCGAVTMGQGAVLKKDTMSLPSTVRPLRQ